MDTTAHAMVRELRQKSEYLSYWDFEPEQRVTVTVEKLVRETNVVTSFGKEPVVYSLQCTGCKKRIWLSSGKIKAMKKLHGNDAKNWIGKKIGLFADPTVKMKGEPVGGIVIEGAK